MGNGIYTALSGTVAQSNALDVTANNVANATTTGFRAERVSFHEVVGKATAKQMAFVTAAGGATDDRPGALRATGAPLDVAITGDAFFGVQTAAGTRYTRNGAFGLDAGGQLITADGAAVRGEGGAPIVVPTTATTITIGGDGTIDADGEAIGRLELTRFAPGDLTREGNTMFIAGRAGQAATADTQVVSGMLEQSNFDVIRGVVDLIRVSRTYEALHRMLDRYRDIDNRTARDIGGPQ